MEPTPEQLKAMQEADAARMVLENPLVARALTTIEQEIMGLWADLPIEKREQADECKRLLHSMRQFKGLFEKLVQGGEIARYELLAAESNQARMTENLRKIYG